MSDEIRACLGELIGTFVFISVILFVGQPIPIVIALLAAIYFCTKLSKQSMNPAVSMILGINGTLQWWECLMYIAIECVGALAAFGLYTWYISDHPKI